MRQRFSGAFSYLQLVNELEGISVDTWKIRHMDARALRSLPEALALINPIVAPISRDDWTRCVGPRSFNIVRPRSTHCASRVVWGYECPQVRVGHQIDHFWPYSLGGRSVVENGLWLCEIHNRAKSDDVHFYAWEEGRFPSWLSITLAHVESRLQ